jgi:hypothetical protein
MAIGIVGIRSRKPVQLPSTSRCRKNALLHVGLFGKFPGDPDRLANPAVGQYRAMLPGNGGNHGILGIL